MYEDRSRHWLLQRVMLYTVFVDEVLLSAKNHQRKETKKTIFQKTTLTLHQQTIEIKQLKQMVARKTNYSSSQTVELHPLFRASIDHSILQP